MVPCLVTLTDSDFYRKSQNFPAPLYFVPPTPDEGVPLEIGNQRWGSKTRTMGLSGWERTLTISSAVWIQTTNVKDRRTDWT